MKLSTRTPIRGMWKRNTKFNKEDKTFRLPVEMNVPVEVENKINKQIEDEILYENSKKERLQKAFDNPNSDFRKVADYVTQKMIMGNQKEISLGKMADDLNIPEASVRGHVSNLNYVWGGGTLIPVKGKTGWLQMATNSEEDFESWRRANARTCVTKERIRNRADTFVSAKAVWKKDTRRRRK